MQRVRTSGAFTSVPWSSTWWNTPNPKPPVVVNSALAQEGTVVVMNDYVTPGFKKLQNQGSIINNPMSRTSETRGFGGGTINFQVPKSGGNTWFAELVGFPIGPLTLSALTGRSIPSYDSMLAEARTRALASVARPDFQGLVSLGELRESLSYLRNPFKGALALADKLNWRISRLYVKERKRRRGGPPIPKASAWKLNPDDAAIIKELESIYLEFRYGVRPMIGEITSALENIRERAVPKPKRQTFRAKQQQVFTDTWSVNASNSGIAHVDTYDYRRTVSVNAGLLYEFTSDFGIGDKWGLQLGQVPATLWALAPLSFVVDWGLNVGQFISALTPVPGATRLADWVSIKVEHKLTRSYSGWFISDSSWSPGQSYSGGKAPDSLSLVTYQRIPDIGFPDLVLKASAVDTLSEGVKVLDLATIFHQKVANALSVGRETSRSIERRIGRPHAASKWY